MNVQYPTLHFSSITDANRPIFAAYLNMAKQNFFATMNLIFANTGIDRKIEDSTFKIVFRELEQHPDSNGKKSIHVNQWIKLDRMLHRHFPMLGPILDCQVNRHFKKEKDQEKKKQDSGQEDKFKVMKSVQIADCFKALRLTATCLNDLRNYYTHYHPYNSTEDLAKQFEVQTQITFYLSDLLDASRRIDKERKELNADRYSFITADGALRRKKFREKVFELNPDFFFSVVRRMNQHSDSDIRKKMSGYDKFILSEFGIIYLTCLFLPKKYIARFLEEIQFFEAGNFSSDKYAIIRDMISIYRFRPFKNRIDSQTGKMALGLDMLNELRRCPRELYEVLSPEARETFKVKSQEEASDDASDTDNNPDKNLLIRSKEDRFSHLALSYIDQQELFDSIRFQVSVGKCRYKFYDKTCVDGEIQVRALQQDIHAFGRIQEIEECRQNAWAEIIKTPNESDELEQDTADTKPYVTDQRSRYAFCGNRIGLLWRETREELNERHLEGEKYYLPDLPAAFGKSSERLDIDTPAPLCWLSIHDIPAMVFYTWLSNHRTGYTCDNKKAESIIIDSFLDLRRFFIAIRDGQILPDAQTPLDDRLRDLGYAFSAKDIPAKIVAYLTEQDSNLLHKKVDVAFRQKLEQRKLQIDKRLKRFKEDRKAIGAKTNVYGKRTHTDIRPGRLAQDVARSIVEWQPSANDGKNKLTGLNFSVLQATLAMFGQSVDITAVKNVLRRAKLLHQLADGSTNPMAHPFLDKVMNLNLRNAEELFMRYFEAESRHLATILMQGYDKHAIPFLHADRARWRDKNKEEIRRLAEQYLDRSKANIMLPTGLFTEAIRKEFKEMSCSTDLSALQKEKLCKIIDSVAQCNAFFYIQQYFSIVVNDEPQPFYRTFKKNGLYNHNYELFDKLYDKRTNAFKQLPHLYFTTDEIIDMVTKRDGKKRGIDNQILQYVDNCLKSPIHKRLSRKELIEFKENKVKSLHHLVNECKKNEQAIRRYMIQDMLLLLMAKDIVKGCKLDKGTTMSNEETFRLKNALTEDFLNQRVDFSITLNKGKYTIKQDGLKLKRYGDFYRILSDPRWPNLLELIQETTIEKNNIDQEFAIYDQKRIEVFRSIQECEKNILANCPELMNDVPDNFTSGKKHITCSFQHLLQKDTQIERSEEEQKQMQLIRNAFAHNNYPTKNVIDTQDISLPIVAQQISKQIETLIKGSH